MPAIVARNLRKAFGDVVAVEDVSLSVEDGEIFGLLGPNGAGKSTTVRMLTTLLRPDSGEILVAGLDPRRQPMDVRRAIGVALQDAGLDDLATGRELLTMHARLQGLKRDAANERAEDLLTRFGIDEAADRRVGTYSGGMRRKLDLAAALVHEPQIVFLDEPTVGLDPAARAQLWSLVRQLNREDGTTVFLTTHYMEEAERLSDRLAVVDRGRVVMQGTAAELKRGIAKRVLTLSLEADEQTLQTLAATLRKQRGVLRAIVSYDSMTLHLGDDAPAPDELRALAEKEARVVGVSAGEPTLDDLFLSTGAIQ